MTVEELEEAMRRVGFKHADKLYIRTFPDLVLFQYDWAPTREQMFKDTVDILGEQGVSKEAICGMVTQVLQGFDERCHSLYKIVHTGAA